MRITNLSLSTYIPTIEQVTNNISGVALPIIAIASIPMAYAGPISYTACVATCNAMAAAAAPGLSYYTFKACIASCWWSGGPGCP